MPRKPFSETRQARRFGVILAILLGAVAVFFYFRDYPGRAWVSGGAAAAVLACTLLAFPLWLALFRQWMKLANALSWVMTRVVLTVFYYVVVTPISLVMRLLGKTPLDLGWRDGRPSYWIDKPGPTEATLKRYEKHF